MDKPTKIGALPPTTHSVLRSPVLLPTAVPLRKPSQKARGAQAYAPGFPYNKDPFSGHLPYPVLPLFRFYTKKFEQLP